MLLYTTIYGKAINLFDDPDINRAYVQNKVLFAKMMYPHLVNGINKFKDPTAITWLLVDRTAPEGKTEVFEASEVSDNSVTLSTQPLANSDYSVTVGGKYVYDYTVETGDDGVAKVVFGSSVVIGDTDEISVEWYNAGQFNTDFAQASAPMISAAVIADKTADILARTLVLAWAEKNKNFLLEIRNILNNTDFNIYSPANSIKAKVDWVKDLQWDVDTMQNKLGWDLHSVSRRAGGYYGA